MVEVVAFPRLHLGLLDLGRVTARAYGGAGFVIAEPATRVQAHAVSEGQKVVVEVLGLDKGRDAALAGFLTQALGDRLPSPCVLSVLQTAPQHIGLGSETSLRLASLTALSGACGLELPQEELQHLSRRGGASGIGIHGFFVGGFLVDVGHPQETVVELLPSAARTTARPPLLLARLDVPDDWMVDLFMPSNPRSDTSGREEIEFFLSNTPVSQDDVSRGATALYHGILPAVAEQDMNSLKAALVSYQMIGFKSAEIRRHGAELVKALESVNTSTEAIAGLSSMGPLVFVIWNDRAESDAARRILDGFGFTSLARTCFRNGGYSFAHGS